MNHCYIFDYCSCNIYHIELPEDIDDIERYICKTYNLSSNTMEFMVSDNE